MTEPVISDAVVEAACIECVKASIAHGTQVKPWDKVAEHERAVLRNCMRAAITAAILADRAETVEKCAAIADEHSSAGYSGYGSETAAGRASAQSIAYHIRALSPSAPTNQAKKATD